MPQADWCTDKNVLIYACSGAANVAEVADLAARDLSSAGSGAMFCLAGIGAGIQSMVQTAEDADLNVLIDGCPVDCARKIFEKGNLTNYVHIRVTDLGIEKLKGVRCTREQVHRVAVKVKARIAEQCPQQGGAK